MQEALDELEGRVSQRTRDLTEANRLLREEVEQHEQTRDELIQAAKLAALGQMSAGINHELNQPLAAMNPYLAGAKLLVQRKRPDEALSSFQRIADLDAVEPACADDDRYAEYDSYSFQHCFLVHGGA